MFPTDNPLIPENRDPLQFLLPDVSLLQRTARVAQQVLNPLPKIKIIDESVWQIDPIDYKKSYEQGGIVGTVIKFTEGDNKVDPRRLVHLNGSQQIGRKNLAYHFLRWNKSGKAQALWFAQFTDPLRAAQGGARYVIDLESLDGTTENQRVDVGGEFCYWFNQELGIANLGIYSSPAWWQQMFPSGMPSWSVGLWKWVAHWTSAAMPTLPIGWSWSNTYLWQNGIWKTYPWCYEVLGYTPNVDTDYGFFADEAAFVKWVGAETTPPPVPPSDPIVPKPTVFAKSLVAGLSVRKKASTSETLVGNLLLNEKVAVLNRLDKPNGEIWLHIETLPTSGLALAGWSCMKMPTYPNPMLMAWV